MLTKYIETYLQNRPLFFSLIRPQEAELFNQHAGRVEPPILDLGCGDGFFAGVVWGKGKIDVGLDLTNERTKKIENAGIYKKIRYFDGVRIPYPDNHFQTIVSNCVLEHVSDIEGLLKEANRVLKPNGFFLTTVMTEKWEEYLLGRQILGKKYVLWMRKKQVHLNVFSPKKWRKVFSTAGFISAKEIGYLSEKTARGIDIFHYLAAPQLISYKLFGKWVLFPQVLKIIKPENIFKRLITYPNNIAEAAAVFYVLRKEASKNKILL